MWGKIPPIHLLKSKSSLKCHVICIIRISSDIYFEIFFGSKCHAVDVFQESMEVDIEGVAEEKKDEGKEKDINEETEKKGEETEVGENTEVGVTTEIENKEVKNVEVVQKEDIVKEVEKKEEDEEEEDIEVEEFYVKYKNL